MAFLHLMSFNYPVNPTKKKELQRFIHDLKYILPCKTCRDNLTNHLEKNPIDNAMKTEKHFQDIYCMHEKINKYLGKDSGLTYNVLKSMNIFDRDVDQKHVKLKKTDVRLHSKIIKKQRQ